MSLNKLIEVIDPEQYIIIKYRGDILFIGKSKYFPACESQSKIYVVNILCIEEDDISKDNGIPYITICIDRGFD